MIKHNYIKIFFKQKFTAGFSLVEVLVSVFIFTVILSILIGANNLYLSGADANLKLTKATYLAEEGIEALKIIRDTSWTDFYNIPADYDHLYFSYESASSTWKATTTDIKIDSFSRSFILSDVYRDSNNIIVQNGGTVDPNTKEATVSISWIKRNGESITKSMSAYIANII